MVGARKAADLEASSVRTALERLARRAGIVPPRLYLITDPFPRALATGRGVTASTVVVSTGLVAAASPAEIEGVLAHEVAHVARRDVIVQTAVVLLASTLVEIARLGGFLQRALLFVLGPVSAAFVHLLLSPKREFRADRIAAELCESPHGLADALLRLDLAGELRGPLGEPRDRAVAHGESLSTRTASGALRHAPAGGRARAPAQGARPGLARQAAGGLDALAAAVSDVGEALRDGIRVRQTRLRAVAHERENGGGERCPERPRLDRADVGSLESSQRLC